MQVGGWARSADGSAVHPGTAGVLIDVVTAYASLTARVLGAATADHAITGWGHSSGTLRDEDGTLLATLGQRMRSFPGDDSPHGVSPGARSGMRNALGSLHGGVSLCFAELAACTGWEASPNFPGELLTFAVATLHRVATM